MSTNLHLYAEYRVGKHQKKMREAFNMWQTPSFVTEYLIKQEDKLSAYAEWVKSVSKPITFNVYAEDDFLSEGDPIGTETVDPGDEHLGYLRRWIERHTENDAKIVWEAW